MLSPFEILNKWNIFSKEKERKQVKDEGEEEEGGKGRREGEGEGRTDLLTTETARDFI